jgi:hypothetical protein
MRGLLCGLLLGVLFVLSTAGPVRADGGLTNAVASAYVPRNVDSGLHSIAHQRVTESSACDCLDHDGMRPGTAEVLAWASGVANPIAHTVGKWMDSPEHNAILSDRSWGRIGCAELVVDGTHWFACVLAAGPLPAAAAPAAPVLVLPDTAMPAEPRRTAPRSRGPAVPI